MYRTLFALVVLSLLAASPEAHAQSKPPVKMIFDTDMGNDIDDAMALAMIHQLARRGAVELLAVTSTKDHPKSVAYIDALNMRVGVMDSTAMAMCMDNDLPIYVVNLWHEGTLEKVVHGEAIGTMITA